MAYRTTRGDEIMNDIATDIQGLIQRATKLPNSKERNKVVSKLEDALALAKVGQAGELKAQKIPSDASVDMPINRLATCTCKPGMIDVNCPLHAPDL
jgi:hypothetical protein